MKLDPPRIHRGPLTGRIYCITHGSILEAATAERGELIEASVKYDVTDQVEALFADTMMLEQVHLHASNALAIRAERDELRDEVGAMRARAGATR